MYLCALPGHGKKGDILSERPSDSSINSSGGAVLNDIAERLVPIGQYTGLYEKVPPLEGAALSESIGNAVSGEDGWYYVSGHSDMQYLIRSEDEEYSLWKFSALDEDEYPYSFVLEHVYQIDSPDKIHAITVSPAKMDNTDEGIAIQEKIGTIRITDRAEIGEIYEILRSLTCYGSNRWDMIDIVGDVDAPADAEQSAHQAVLLGRYLSIETDQGNEIDGLKYTAVSNMFYEFMGIAYNRLSDEQAERINDILGIETEIDDLENGADQVTEHPADEERGKFPVEQAIQMPV